MIENYIMIAAVGIAVSALSLVTFGWLYGKAVHRSDRLPDPLEDER
jgi:hypothetical protein